jgi:hypothetical protein
MHCVSNVFGCPGLAAKGRRNRLIAISQLPCHQRAVSLAAFPSFPERGCSTIFYRSLHVVAFVLLVSFALCVPAFAQIVDGSTTAADGSPCTAGWFAWPDPNGRALICVGGVYQVVSTSSQWTTTGSNIYYNGGNVGIGTTAPITIFDVRPQANTNFLLNGASTLGSDTLVLGNMNDAASAYEPMLFQASVYDFANGNVGIGTTAPAWQLDVATSGAAVMRLLDTANGAASTNGMVLYESGVNGGINVQDNLPLTLATNNSTKMEILANGNVGIGTTNPTLTGSVGLNIAGTSGQSVGMRLTGGNGYSYEWLVGASNNNIGLYNPSATAYAIYITSGGDVGIGTTSPLTYLDIAPAPISNVGGVLYIRDNTGVAGTIKIANFNGGNYLESGLANTGGSAAPLYFTNMGAGSTWMTISSTGNVGIGTTAPANRLDVAGGVMIGAGGSFAGNADGTTNSLAVQGSIGIGTPTPQYNLDVYGGTIRFASLLSAAGVGTLCLDSSYPISWVSSNTCIASDRRLKERIKPLGPALNDIMRLKPVTFYWNEKSKNPDKRQRIGLIAQDVEEVIPLLVNTDSKGTKSVSYDLLVSPLIKAVQELKSDNDELRHEFDAYKAAHP